jgi:2-keto-4-pentenoate hydratase/2-oxohepta-3-ene-1,7-dioic acid hydratase in catechol pathway
MENHMSEDAELRAGEFPGSGTIGNGCGLEVDCVLEHGNVVELEIERIGTPGNGVLRPENMA